MRDEKEERFQRIRRRDERRKMTRDEERRHDEILEHLEDLNESLREIRDTFASMAVAFASMAEEDEGAHSEAREGDTDALAEAISRLAGKDDEPNHGITAWGRPNGWGNDGD